MLKDSPLCWSLLPFPPLLDLVLDFSLLLVFLFWGDQLLVSWILETLWCDFNPLSLVLTPWKSRAPLDLSFGKISKTPFWLRSSLISLNPWSISSSPFGDVFTSHRDHVPKIWRDLDLFWLGFDSSLCIFQLLFLLLEFPSLSFRRTVRHPNLLQLSLKFVEMFIDRSWHSI